MIKCPFCEKMLRGDEPGFCHLWDEVMEKWKGNEEHRMSKEDRDLVDNAYWALKKEQTYKDVPVKMRVIPTDEKLESV